MLEIEIKSEAIAERKGTSANGKDWHMREQQGYAFTYDRDGKLEEYPSKIVVLLEDGAAPYKPGRYTLAPQSFYVGQYGKLTLGRIALQPLKASGVRAA